MSAEREGNAALARLPDPPDDYTRYTLDNVVGRWSAGVLERREYRGDTADQAVDELLAHEPPDVVKTEDAAGWIGLAVRLTMEQQPTTAAEGVEITLEIVRQMREAA